MSSGFIVNVIATMHLESRIGVVVRLRIVTFVCICMKPTMIGCYGVKLYYFYNYDEAKEAFCSFVVEKDLIQQLFRIVHYTV